MPAKRFGAQISNLRSPNIDSRNCATFGAQCILCFESSKLYCSEAHISRRHTVVLCATLTLLRMFRSSAVAMQLTDLKFDNSSLRALPNERVPEDPRKVEPQRQVKGACWSPIKPEPLKSPVLVAASSPCLALLDLQASQVCSAANKNSCANRSGACRLKNCTGFLVCVKQNPG